MNKGVPTWSDEYQCVEWPLVQRVVDVMALGNHDLDYGAESSSGAGRPQLPGAEREPGGERMERPTCRWRASPTLVREVGGVRLGFFAVAGPDMRGW